MISLTFPCFPYVCFEEEVLSIQDGKKEIFKSSVKLNIVCFCNLAISLAYFLCVNTVLTWKKVLTSQYIYAQVS